MTRKRTLSPRRRGRLVLVLGGASSGKSAAALTLAGNKGRRAFVATAEALDPEMMDRIGRHRKARSAVWETAEVPIDLVGWFLAKGLSYQSVVVDCVTLWLSNLQGRGISEVEILRRVSTLLEAIPSCRARVVLVSNELGMGLVPAEATARAFRDLAGQVNQQIARLADEVYLAVAGIPVRLK